MSQKVIIPTPLRKFTSGQETVEVNADTIADVFTQLESQYPGIKARLCETTGELRRFINVYVDGEDIRFLNNTETQVRDGAEVAIVPAISGGSDRG